MEHLITIINANQLSVDAITSSQEIKNLGGKLDFEDQVNNVNPLTEILVISGFSFVTRNDLAKLTNLKLIATMSTGFDKIDLAECSQRGIKVVNVPSYGATAVSEYTINLILELARKTYLTINDFKATDNITESRNEGIELSGKTLGIIGTGAIGRRVAKTASTLGMTILAYDKFQHNELKGYYADSLVDLLKNSNFISVHLPLNDQTYHLINQNNISQIKKGAYLVNTARGEVIDSKPLVDALMSKQIAGAALDVFEDENKLDDPQYSSDPLTIINKQLINLPNVIATPHNAYNTIEAKQTIANTTINSLVDYLKNKPLTCLVN